MMSNSPCMKDTNIKSKLFSKHRVTSPNRRPQQSRTRFFQFALKSPSETFLARNVVSVLNYELNKTKSSKHAVFTQRTLDCSGAWIFWDPPNTSLCFMVWLYTQKPLTKVTKAYVARKTGGDRVKTSFREYCSACAAVMQLKDGFVNVISRSVWTTLNMAYHGQHFITEMKLLVLLHNTSWKPQHINWTYYYRAFSSRRSRDPWKQRATAEHEEVWTESWHLFLNTPCKLLQIYNLVAHRSKVFIDFFFFFCIFKDMAVTAHLINCHQISCLLANSLQPKQKSEFLSCLLKLLHSSDAVFNSQSVTVWKTMYLCMYVLCAVSLFVSQGLRQTTSILL